MGMFDWIRVEMPLPESEKPLPESVNDGYQFQTKDTPGCCFMDEFTIRADGTLHRAGYDIEDRSDPTAVGLARIAGMMTHVPNPELDETFPDFHGDIFFYCYRSRDRHTWTYRARFTEGVCTSIVSVKERSG